jgi:hypothetical protein
MKESNPKLKLQVPQYDYGESKEEIWDERNMENAKRIFVWKYQEKRENL